jgi:ATP-dependent RNA helicase DDX46/PRP5
MTGASVTNKGKEFLTSKCDLFLKEALGIYYESGKEPPPDGPPKLHLLIESNEEWRVRNFGLLHLVITSFFL